MTAIHDLTARKRLEPLIAQLAASTQFSWEAIRSTVDVLAAPAWEAVGAPWTEDEITQGLPVIVEAAVRGRASLMDAATLFRQTLRKSSW